MEEKKTNKLTDSYQPQNPDLFSFKDINQKLENEQKNKDKQRIQKYFYTKCIECQQEKARVNKIQNPGLFNEKYICENCHSQGYILICSCNYVSTNKEKFKEYTALRCQNIQCNKFFTLAVCPYKKCVNEIGQNFNLSPTCHNCNKQFYSFCCKKCQNFYSASDIQKHVSLDMICQQCQVRQEKLKCFNCDITKVSSDNLEKCEQCESRMFPNNWQYMDEDENCHLVPIEIYSEEGLKIQEKFVTTLLNTDQQQDYEITKICRVQNKIQWENYQYEKQRMKNTHIQQKLVPFENHQELWHGTRTTDPRLLCMSAREAFDPTFSRETNLWGQAIYFSEKSQYSAQMYGYGQIDNEGRDTKIIMLADIAAGYGKVMPAQKIVKPPYFYDQDDQKLKGQYDCVIGQQNNNKFCMLYGSDTRRAYPTYLVAFVSRKGNIQPLFGNPIQINRPNQIQKKK